MLNFFFLFQKKSIWNKLYRAESAPEEIHKELSKMQNEVMEDYYKANKCGEVEFEKDWELELINLMKQIKNGFVVSVENRR